MLAPGYFISNVVDHAWAEVNPSNDGKTWIHVEVSDSCKGIKNGRDVNDLIGLKINNFSCYHGRNYKMVLAFQVTEDRQVIIVDRTSAYSP